MNACIRRLASGTALVLAAACSRPGGEAAGAAGRASGMTAADHAVAAGHAIQANPTATDSILVAHGLTRAGFDSLLYDVAADSALARAYAEAMRN